MKKKSLILAVLATLLTVFMVSCIDDLEEDTKTASILPSSFNIDVPTSLANSSGLKSGSTSIDGNEVYEMMRAFVAIGNGSGAIVKDLMTAISYYNIDKPMNITYLSADDNRYKNLIVTADEILDGNIYEFKMVIKDVHDQSTSPTGLEMYWNRAPIKGVSIFSFYNLNRRETKNKEARFRIDYNENDPNYDKTMQVSIVGIDTVGVDDNVNNLKMFVGKKGNILDVYGNANLPKAKIIDSTHVNGYNWAFVARSNEALNIAVAQVALPPCTLNNLTNIFSTYSILNVLTSEINIAYPSADPEFVANFLVNTNTPAYFNGAQGFLSCGPTKPTTSAGFTDEFVDLSNLKPYYPFVINALNISFSDELNQ